MFARMFRIRASADRLEEGLQVLRGSSEDVRAMAGFRHGYALIDRQAGELVTVTFWESETAMNAAQPRAREILAGAVQAIGGDVSGPNHYEVGLEL
jgi:heme-degrading monooxygenase HmoA